MALIELVEKQADGDLVREMLPLRSFGISSAIRPARVSQSRSRYPLR